MELYVIMARSRRQLSSLQRAKSKTSTLKLTSHKSQPTGDTIPGSTPAIDEGGTTLYQSSSIHHFTFITIKPRDRNYCQVPLEKIVVLKDEAFTGRKDIRQKYLQGDLSAKALRDLYIALSCRSTAQTTSTPFSIMDCPLPGREGRTYSSSDIGAKQYIPVSLSDMMSHSPPRLLFEPQPLDTDA